MNKNDTVSFLGDDGNSSDVEILEQTRINGVNYLLVYSEEEDGAFIFKETGSIDDQDSAYEEVMDEEERESVFKIFEQLMEDTDFEME